MSTRWNSVIITEEKTKYMQISKEKKKILLVLLIIITEIIFELINMHLNAWIVSNISGH